MDARRRGAPWSAALTTLLVISWLLAFAQPARATGTDYGAGAGDIDYAETGVWGCYNTVTNAGCGGTAGFSDGVAGTLMYDASCPSNCTTRSIGYKVYNGHQYIPAGTVLTNVELTFYTGGTPLAGTFEIQCLTNGVLTPATGSLTYAGTVTAALTTPCTIGTGGPSSDSGIVMTELTNTNAGGTSGLGIIEFKIYGAATVGIEQYCYDMAVGHPAFAWTGSCKFRQAFEGTIVFTASPAGSFKVGATGNAQYNPSVSFTPTGGFGPGSGGAFTAGIDFEQDCYPLCQSDTITMTITDTTNGQSASYDFLRADDGLLQDPTYLPIFTSYSGCYNASTNQCGHSSASGTTDIEWAWTCNLPSGTIKVVGVDQAPDCTGSDSTVQIGPLNAATAGFTVTRYSVNAPGQAAGSYHAYGLTTSTTQNRIWIIELANPRGTTRGSVTLDFTSGGNTDTYTKPTADNGETCAGLDFGCALRNFFYVSGNALVDLVSDVVDDLRDLALTRQPFNWIVRAFDGVSAQLGRAAAAVTTTSTCTGYVMVLPTSPPVHYNTPAATFTVQTWPTSVPAPSFAVLKCADLEPWGGTTWYQNIRAAMDPAIYLGWGLAQLKTLRRGPVAA